MAEGAVDFYKNGLPLLLQVLAPLGRTPRSEITRCAVGGWSNCFSALQFCAKTVQIFRGISSGLYVSPSQGYRSELAKMRFPLGGVSARNRAGECRSGDPFARSSEATLGLVFFDKISPR
jgi:hypothetical protein